MNSVWQIIIIAVTLIAIFTQASAGQESYGASNYRMGSVPGTIVTEQKAIMVAQLHVKGRVLAINHADEIFRIKILSEQGTIHVILVNAQDGSVLQPH